MEKQFVIYSILEKEVKVAGTAATDYNESTEKVKVLESTEAYFNTVEEAEQVLERLFKEDDFRRKTDYTILTEYSYSK